MPPAVGGGIRYMAEGGVDGAGCIPLPVPENRPSFVRIHLAASSNRAVVLRHRARTVLA